MINGRGVFQALGFHLSTQIAFLQSLFHSPAAMLSGCIFRRRRISLAYPSGNPPKIVLVLRETEKCHFPARAEAISRFRGGPSLGAGLFGFFAFLLVLFVAGSTPAFLSSH